MPKKMLEPKQARSRESLSRLLKATAQVLQSHSLEGATIPRIAKQAGLSPGAVYRRFKSKDALIEAVILHMMEKQDERLGAAANMQAARDLPLARLALQSFRGMLSTYRNNAGFLRAAYRFAETRRNTAFYRKVEQLETRAFEGATDLFMLHKKEIKHPNARKAVATGLLMVVAAVREVAFSESKNWSAVFAENDDDLARELTCAFLSYLGISER